MVLIISNEYDLSTCKVIDYFLETGKRYLVIHDTDFYKYVSVEIGNNKVEVFLEIDEKLISLQDFTSFWYRRGRVNRKFNYLGTETYQKVIEEHLLNEWDYLQKFIHRVFEQLPGIGAFYEANYTSA